MVVVFLLAVAIVLTVAFLIGYLVGTVAAVAINYLEGG